MSPLRADAGFIGLALAAFALGSQFTPLEKPQGVSRTTVDEKDPGLVFHNQVRMLIPDLIERPNLRSIQVTFLMGIYLLPSSAVGSSFVYMGLALRQALAFELHQETDDPSLDEHEREVRRRLWWALYSLERYSILALILMYFADVDQNHSDKA